jgi:hypothetical protein
MNKEIGHPSTVPQLESGRAGRETLICVAQRRGPGCVYECPVAAVRITTHLKQRNSVSFSSGSQKSEMVLIRLKSRHRQSCVLSRGLVGVGEDGGPFSCLFQLLEAARSLGSWSCPVSSKPAAQHLQISLSDPLAFGILSPLKVTSSQDSGIRPRISLAP